MSAVAPDLAGAAFAAMLGFAAVIAAMTAVAAPRTERGYLRFAAGLAAAVAIADIAAALGGGGDAAILADAVTLLVAALSSSALALGAAAHFTGAPRRTNATIALIAACLAGLGGAATGSALLALGPLVVSVMAMGIIAARSWKQARRAARLLALTAAATLAAAAAYVSGGGEGRTAFALFFAAALLGGTLALARRSDGAVEQRGRRPQRSGLFIGGEK